MLRSCPSCARPNRIPASKLASAGHCGACKAPLAAAAEPLEVDAAGFQEIVAGASVPILVDFWAPWCGPCRMAAPQVSRVASELAGRALVLKLNTDENPELASAWEIRSIPTFAVIRAGQLVSRNTGLADARQMRGWLEQAGA